MLDSNRVRDVRVNKRPNRMTMGDTPQQYIGFGQSLLRMPSAHTHTRTHAGQTPIDPDFPCDEMCVPASMSGRIEGDLGENEGANPSFRGAHCRASTKGSMLPNRVIKMLGMKRVRVGCIAPSRSLKRSGRQMLCGSRQNHHTEERSLLGGEHSCEEAARSFRRRS